MNPHARTIALTVVMAIFALLPACSTPFLGGSGGGTGASRSAVTPHHKSVRLRQAPEAAARCFARNAEEHSSALVAEVTGGPSKSDVIVRVKNGLVYALASFARAGSGSSADITLNVTTSGSMGDLLGELTEGC